VIDNHKALLSWCCGHYSIPRYAGVCLCHQRVQALRYLLEMVIECFDMIIECLEVVIEYLEVVIECTDMIIEHLEVFIECLEVVIECLVETFFIFVTLTLCK